MELCRAFGAAFGFATQEGESSNFVSGSIEVMKHMYLGQNGHIAIRTASIPRAIADLTQKGFEVDMETAKYKNGGIAGVYIKQAFGPFAVHLLQK